MKLQRANKPDAVNPAIAFRFAVGDRWRRVTDLEGCQANASECSVLLAAVDAIPAGTCWQLWGCRASLERDCFKASRSKH